MRFPAKKNAGCPKAPCSFPPKKDGILHPPPSGCLGTPLPQSLYGQAYADVTTKISRIDRLPNLLSNAIWCSASSRAPLLVQWLNRRAFCPDHKVTRSIATGWDHRLISQNLPQWHQFIHLGGARKCSFSSSLSSSFPLLLPLLHLFIFLFCPVSPTPRPLLCVFLVLVLLLLLLLFIIINLFLLHHPLLLCIPLFFSYFVCSSSSFTFPFSSSIYLPPSAPCPSPPRYFYFILLLFPVLPCIFLLLLLLLLQCLLFLLLLLFLFLFVLHLSSSSLS